MPVDATVETFGELTREDAALTRQLPEGLNRRIDRHSALLSRFDQDREAVCKLGHPAEEERPLCEQHRRRELAATERAQRVRQPWHRRRHVTLRRRKAGQPALT